MMVLIAPASVGRRRDVAVGVLFGQQQLDADPEQQQRADDLEPGNRQQLQGEEDQHDAQADGAHHAPEDALLALFVAAACGRPGR
jgi:FtsZ-interacting cell division protein ZipA